MLAPHSATLSPVLLAAAEALLSMAPEPWMGVRPLFIMLTKSESRLERASHRLQEQNTRENKHAHGQTAYVRL